MCKTADGAAERVAAAVEWAKRIAIDDSHGYSQASRYGPDYDCSSMVITAFKQVGVPVGNAITTFNMRSEFLKCRLQEHITRLIMSGAACIAYIIGEGLVEAKD